MGGQGRTSPVTVASPSRDRDRTTRVHLLPGPETTWSPGPLLRPPAPSAQEARPVAEAGRPGPAGADAALRRRAALAAAAAALLAAAAVVFALEGPRPGSPAGPARPGHRAPVSVLHPPAPAAPAPTPAP